MGSVDPLQITVNEERQDTVLAPGADQLSDVNFTRTRNRWVVSLRAGHTDNLVVRVLDAVRVSGEPTAWVSSPSTATYHMQKRIRNDPTAE